ncbi:MAG: translation initiation factor [Chlorobi bacterium]|nr:translation initiation factor [Chlorobiota bacterium]
MSKKKQKYSGIVYSTNEDFDYNREEDEVETLAPNKQDLRISLDKKQRKGKKVTLIEGFIGTDGDLSDLGKTLKTKCGVGGSSKDGWILIQGDHREKVKVLLEKMGYKYKML